MCVHLKQRRCFAIITTLLDISFRMVMLSEASVVRPVFSRARSGLTLTLNLEPKLVGLLGHLRFWESTTGATTTCPPPECEILMSKKPPPSSCRDGDGYARLRRHLRDGSVTRLSLRATSFPSCTPKHHPYDAKENHQKYIAVMHSMEL